MKHLYELGQILTSPERHVMGVVSNIEINKNADGVTIIYTIKANNASYRIKEDAATLLEPRGVSNVDKV